MFWRWRRRTSTLIVEGELSAPLVSMLLDLMFAQAWNVSPGTVPML